IDLVTRVQTCALPTSGRGRVLVVGDAAGFVNAFTAEGIYYAMVSGELAAKAIIESADAPSRKRLAVTYRRACEREIGAELRDSRSEERRVGKGWRSRG